MLAKSLARRRTHRRPTTWFSRLLWLEPFWLLGLAPSLLFTEYFWEPALRPLLIIALFVFWPLRLKAGQPLLPRGAVGWFLGFLLLWLPVALWRSTNSALAWEVAGYLYFALVSFVALIHWPPLRHQPDWLVLLLLGLGVALALVGPEVFSVDPDKLLDVYQAEEFDAAGPTSVVETINPNILGGALALILPLGLALALHWQWARWRWLALLLWAPILIMGNGLLLSQSRSGWLALGIAGLLLIGLLLSDIASTTNGGKLPLWRRTCLGLFVVGLLVALVLFWLVSVVSNWLAPEIQQNIHLSLTRRMAIWRLSLQLVANNPLTGIGLGMYEETFVKQFPTLPLVGGRLAPPHAHQLFLQVALDLGLPGLLAYLGLWAVLLRSLGSRLWQRWRVPPSSAPAYAAQSVALGVASALVAMLVVGCFDNALWGTKLTFIPWCLFALVLIAGVVPHDREI